MANFYKNYSKTNSFFDASYLSKLDYLKNAKITNAKKSPYYWSSFVYYGAIDSNESNYFYYILFGLIAIIILLLTYGRFTAVFKKQQIQKNKV